jgi:hypothetical protein
MVYTQKQRASFTGKFEINQVAGYLGGFLLALVRKAAIILISQGFSARLRVKSEM